MGGMYINNWMPQLNEHCNTLGQRSSITVQALAQIRS